MSLAWAATLVPGSYRTKYRSPFSSFTAGVPGGSGGRAVAVEAMPDRNKADKTALVMTRGTETGKGRLSVQKGERPGQDVTGFGQLFETPSWFAPWLAQINRTVK